ncbi:uncharacterized protein [Antedon mediterranea]|uniref:uncharacterized protein n=1 Tax=Antedon mediterranea TaxID=105859 RepID=UPI003AF40CF0
MNNAKHVSPSMKNENTKPSLSNVLNSVIQRLKGSPVRKKIKAVLTSKKQKRHEGSNSDSNRNERRHLEFPTDGLSTSSSSNAEISDFSPNDKSVYKYTDERIRDVKYNSQKKAVILNEKIKSMKEKRKSRCIGETAAEPSTSSSSEEIVYSNSKSCQVSSVQETADHKFKVRNIEESSNLEEITLSSDTLSTSDIEAGLDLPISTEKVAVAKKSWKIEVVSLISDSDTDTNSVLKSVPETGNRSDLMPQRLESEQSKKTPVNHHHQTYVNAIKEVASTSKVTSTGAVNLKIHKQVRSEQAVTAGLQSTAASTVAHKQVRSEQGVTAGLQQTAVSTVAQHQVRSEQVATVGRQSTAVSTVAQHQVRSKQVATVGCQGTAVSTVAQHQVRSEQVATVGRQSTAVSTVAQHQVRSEQAATVGCQSTAVSTVAQHQVRSKQVATVGCQSTAVSTVAQHQVRSKQVATVGCQGTAVSTVAQHQVRSKQVATAGHYQRTAVSTVAQHQVRSEQAATVGCQSTAVSTVAQHQVRSKQVATVGCQGTAVSTVAQHQVRSKQVATAGHYQRTAVSTVAQHQVRSEQAATVGCQGTAVSTVAQHQVRSKQVATAGHYQRTAVSTFAQHQVRSEQAATVGRQSTAVSTVAQHQVRSEQVATAGHYQRTAVSTVGQHQVRSEQVATAGHYQRTAVSTVAQHQRSSESGEHNVHRWQSVEINLKPTYNVKCEGLVNVILHWKPEWLEQHEVRQEEILRPLGLNVPLRENPNLFSSIDEYYRGFVPLLLLETWSEVVQEYPQNKKNKLRCRCIGCPGCFIKCQAMSGEQETYPAVSDLVILSPNKPRKDNNYFVFGIIRDRKIENVLKDKKTVKLIYKLQIETDISQYISYDVDMKMQVVASLVSNLRVFSIIEDLPKLVLARDILYPRKRRKIQTIPSLCPITTKLNDSQTKAADNIFTCVESAYGIPHINLLHGPPGTGKTRTIVNIIERILKASHFFLCIHFFVLQSLFVKVHKFGTPYWKDSQLLPKYN